MTMQAQWLHPAWRRLRLKRTRPGRGTSDARPRCWLWLLLVFAAACGGDDGQASGAGVAAGSGGASAAGAGGDVAGAPAAGSGGAGSTAAGNGTVPPSAAGAGGMSGRGSRGGRGGAGAGAGAAGGGVAVAGMGAGAAGGGGSSAGSPDAGVPAPDSGTESCTPDAQPPQNLMLTGNLGTHDPVVIESGGRFFLFHTGRGVPTKTSNDLRAWQAGGPVFSSNPGWIAQQVPGATDLWAPDISFFGGRYHLYYSASTFGSNKSCIGHATRTSLTEGSWADQGSVVCSNANGARDDWNAIDPNVIVDAQGEAWLSFGSFWSGIKMIALDGEGKRKGTELISLAGRGGGGAIEAPFIVKRCDFYYLFVSFDACCRGADSTYKIAVGRSREVRGPYTDRAGMQLMRGGGTVILQGDARWKGPGHNAVIVREGKAYNVYHAYQASDGRSMLRISELAWDADGWPSSAGP